jgi:hypothetical protein
VIRLETKKPERAEQKPACSLKNQLCIGDRESRNLYLVSRSTTEAEFYDLTEGISETGFLQDVLYFLYFKSEGKICGERLFYAIAQPARRISISVQSIASRKHFEIKHFCIRQEIGKQRVQIHSVPTIEQIADVFTKSLARPQCEVIKEGWESDLLMTYL